MQRQCLTECCLKSIMSEQDSWEPPFYSPSRVEDDKFPLLYDLEEHNWEYTEEGKSKHIIWSDVSRVQNSSSQPIQPNSKDMKRRRQDKAKLSSENTSASHTISVSETKESQSFPYNPHSSMMNEAMHSDSSMVSAPAVCMTTRIQASQVDEILETVGQPPIFHSSGGKPEEELREQRKQHLRALKSLTPEQRALRRILRNRKSAANARKRQLERLQQLELENEELRSKISRLEEKLQEYEKMS